MSKEKLKGIEPDLNGNVYFIAKKNTRSVKKGHIAYKLSGDGNYEVMNNDYKYLVKRSVENNPNVWERIDYYDAKPIWEAHWKEKSKQK